MPTEAKKSVIYEHHFLVAVQCGYLLLGVREAIWPCQWIVRVHVSRMHSLFGFTLPDDAVRDSVQTLG